MAARHDRTCASARTNEGTALNARTNEGTALNACTNEGTALNARTNEGTALNACMQERMGDVYRRRVHARCVSLWTMVSDRPMHLAHMAILTYLLTYLPWSRAGLCTWHTWP